MSKRNTQPTRAQMERVYRAAMRFAKERERFVLKNGDSPPFWRAHDALLKACDAARKGK